MLACIASSQFIRDVEDCKDRCWSKGALREALAAIVSSGTQQIPAWFRARPLTGQLEGLWAAPVRSGQEPPARTWLILFRPVPRGVVLVRTGRCLI